ncbi:TadE family type IV pilus minor pilin [uncultured Phycicoccus sp.]|uniref:TadE family type IV pilus minor pilin n=1 Tax=uncultured Phycicoccus sp. TaxID=661422 RepID=UPI002605567F|nr:TadE family type IV pilus minor pilin [uncultured Phycicoccus sp.]
MSVRRRADPGMVTAELAVAIPVLVVVLALALSAVRLGLDRVRVVDAAHVGARLAARGEGPLAVRAAALRAAPRGAQVHTALWAGSVRVTVRAPAPPMLAGLGLDTVVSGSAVARLESPQGGSG